MVTSRPVPQQTAQIFSPLAGQNRSGLRFSQIGQDTNSPRNIRTIQQNTRWGDKRQKRGTKTQALMTLFWMWREGKIISTIALPPRPLTVHPHSFVIGTREL